MGLRQVMAKIALAPSAQESNETMTELVLSFLSKLSDMIFVFPQR